MKPNPIGTFLFVVFMILYCLMLVPFTLVSIALYFLGVPKKNFSLFWYNQDRTLASGLWATSQETISSEVGRVSLGAGTPNGWTPRYKFEAVWMKALAKWLNTNQRIWGANHCAVAIQHADSLDAADNGHDQ